jgi:hypothetical protein
VHRIALLLALLRIGAATLQQPSEASVVRLNAPLQDDFKRDFEASWRMITLRYAYSDKKATGWESVPKLYAGDLEHVKTREEFITFLEHVIDELYDPHVQLNEIWPSLLVLCRQVQICGQNGAWDGPSSQMCGQVPTRRRPGSKRMTLSCASIIRVFRMRWRRG